MTFNVEDWLNAPYNGKPFSDRLCFLLEANSGPNVYGWDKITYVNGHQYGLEMNDALELMRCVAFIEGLKTAGIDVFPAIHKRTELYRKLNNI